MEAHEFIKSEEVVNAYSDYGFCGICYLKGIVRSDSGEVLWYLVADYKRLNPWWKDDNLFPLHRPKANEFRLTPFEYEAFIREQGLRAIDYEYDEKNKGYRVLYREFPSYRLVGGNIVLDKRGEFRLLKIDDDIAVCLDFRGKPYSFKYRGKDKECNLEIDELYLSRIIGRVEGFAFALAVRAEQYLRSSEYKTECGRNSFTGADCSVYGDDEESFGGLSVVDLSDSRNGFCQLSKAVTTVRLFSEVIESSGVKVLSLKECDYLSRFTIVTKRGALESFCLILPAVTNEYPTDFTINLVCKEFRLIGRVNRVKLVIKDAFISEIDNYTLEHAEYLSFTNCTGIPHIIAGKHSRLERLFLHGTDTEFVDCNVKNLVDIEKCQKLRIVKVNFDWLDSTYINDMINECYALEEIHISTDSIYLNFYGQTDVGLTVNLTSYSNLRRVSFTLNAGSNSGRIDVDEHWGDYKAEILVNRGVEVTLSKKLKQYFKVFRESRL